MAVKKKTPVKSKRAVSKKGSTKTAALEEVPVASALMFYSDVLDSQEQKARLSSNSLRYLDPLSTGVLCLDRALGGGLYNTFASIAGPEASGKTTSCYHAMSTSIRTCSFTGLFDAEGTLNPDYASNVFRPFGIDFKSMMSTKPSPMRYYRNNVIEKVIDLIHGVLKMMPDKVWVDDLQSWGYVIPKNNKYFKSMMEARDMKPIKDFSTDTTFLCQAENSGIEGAFFIDSLAAMVTEEDDDHEQRSKRRAAEAASFSLNMKRIVSRLSSKGVSLFGVNQLRKIPGQTYGDPNYEPGGEAIKFYSAQRLRIASRVPKDDTQVDREKETGHAIEASVQKKGGKDRYAYKFFKNTKNKITFPGHSGFVRVWISDAFGDVRGIDPFYDVLEYLGKTDQIIKYAREKKANGGGWLYKFNLLPTVGAKRAKLLNSCKPVNYMQLKALILGEVDKDVRLLKVFNNAAKIKEGVKVNLRDSLFNQIRTDPSVLKVNVNVKAKGDTEQEDESEVEEI